MGRSKVGIMRKREDSKGPVSILYEENHAVENVSSLDEERLFDERRMRSVIGRGATRKGVSSKELINEMRGRVELP